MKKIERLNDRLNDLNALSTLDETDTLIRNETIYRIEELKKQSKNIRIEIYDALDQLDNYNEVEILEMFFIFDYDFDTIAEETAYSVRHVIRAYSSGIRKIEL